MGTFFEVAAPMILPKAHDCVKPINTRHRSGDTTHSSEDIELERARNAISLPNFDNIPAELKDKPNWNTWDLVMVGDTIKKKPDQSVKRPTAWLPFSAACDWVKSGASVGFGFVLNGDGIVGIDLDHCISADGTLHEMAEDLIAMGTYTETSPSGRGLRSFIKATIVESRNIASKNGIPRHEIYDGRKGSARYLTVTGNRVGDVSEIRKGPEAQAALDAFVAKWFPKKPQPNEVPGRAEISDPSLDDDQVLKLMFGAKNGAKSHRLFDGDYSGYDSQSEADLALCGILRFFTRGNVAQMQRLFRRSGLMRPKWCDLHGEQTYGEGTIAASLAKGGPLYVPRDHRAERTKAEKLRTHERKAWAKLPLQWMTKLRREGELTFCVLWVITSYANKNGEAFPSVETIAAHVGASKRHVYVALAKLKGLGLITSEQRPRTSNLYRLASRVSDKDIPDDKDR